MKKSKKAIPEVSRLERHLGYWLRFVSNHVTHAFMQKVEAQGVTVAEWALMRVMFESGPAPPSVLAERLGMSRGAISKLVDRLVEKRLAVREESAVDGRRQSVALTAAGKRLVPVLARLADENDQQFFGHWDADVQAGFAALLEGLVRQHGWKEIPVR